MNELFQQYKGYFIVGGVILLILMVIVIAVMLINNQVGKPVTPQTENPDTQNQLDYGFIKNSELSDQDKYLMLEAKILIEGYGTYSYLDTRGLYDVKNQSTPDFASKVDAIISSIGQQSFTTSVDPDSIKLQTQSASRLVTLEAKETNLNTQQTISKQYQVDFVKSGDYWLVSNIVSQ